MSEHSKYAPSSVPRWLGCSGSIQLCDQCPKRKDDKYNIEGSLAHELARHCLMHEIDAVDLIGEPIHIKNHQSKITEDMAESVQIYLDKVRELLIAAKLSVRDKYVLIEQKVDLSILVEGMFGTTDFSCYDKTQKKLHVIDYKHGQGVEVFPEHNAQLMSYAIGGAYEIMKLDKGAKIDTIEITIVQPRVFNAEEPVKSWELSGPELIDWGLNVLVPGALRTQGLQKLLMSVDYCRFCSGLAICPEHFNKAKEIAKTDFNNADYPAPEALTNEEIGKALYFSDNLIKWLKEIKAYALNQMEKGVKLEGFKLVKKRALRRWIDAKAAENELTTLIGEKAYEVKVISVPKAESALKKENLSPEACLEGLWEKPDAGLTIASIEDKRAECQTSLEQEFLLEADFLK